jgi:type I phosphodiesterase/nucleotide pyrophosphatase
MAIFRSSILSRRSCDSRLGLSARPAGRRPLTVVAAILFFVSLQPAAQAQQAQAKRIVLVKVDGLPYQMVDRFVRERDPLTGKSRLPWFDYIFYTNGTRVANFYVRGMSLSAPAWSLVDTGQHLHIKGNVEFDRDILHTYDYLNFLPFVVKQATRGNVDMPGMEVLDSIQVPTLMDAYDNYQRLAVTQLYGRGARIKTLQLAAEAKFVRRNPVELATEFLTGLDTRDIIADQLERELVARLSDERVRYLDFLTMDFDHTAHHNNDRESHLEVLRKIDALMGRLWTAIQKSPMAADTALIVVSDHGFNTNERVISQGFNLVKLLGSRAGGGHHIVTKRRLLMDYSVKGVNPFVPPITTPATDSYYLKGQTENYPTVLLDFDGNERAALHLRNTNLNVIQILFQQIQRKDLSPQLRSATTEGFFSAIDRDRGYWQDDLDRLDRELAALGRSAEDLRKECLSQPKKFSPAEIELGRDDNARRICIRSKQAAEFQSKYVGYVAIMRNLLGLKRESFDPQKLKIEELIPKDSMGRRNSIHELQNYVVGLDKNGLVLKDDGTIDFDRSFVRLNYFDLLRKQTVRNNVQAELSTQPVDFVATRIPRDAIAPALADDLKPDDDVVWLYSSPERQALVLSRGESGSGLSLRYLPIANLTQTADGVIRFDRAEWKIGLPLKVLEDPRLDIGDADRSEWLGEWHTDVEWLHALHKTQYSNGLIGLHEQFTFFTAPGTDTEASDLSADERLLNAFHRRQRRLVETDLMVFANNHWNFDVRGFNPGGNHGSLFRISTHSTLMFAGGAGTGIPRGLVVTEPYDSLSVVPTILALTGNLESDNRPVDSLARRGFKKFPGRVITEVLSRESRVTSHESLKR